MFELICDALIGQDIHTWERKSLINERFFKIQHLASRLNDKIQKLRHDSMLGMQDLLKRTQEANKRLEGKMKDKMFLMGQNFEKDHDSVKHLIHNQQLNNDRIKAQSTENYDKLLTEIRTVRKDCWKIYEDTASRTHLDIIDLKKKVTVTVDANDPDFQTMNADEANLLINSRDSLGADAAANKHTESLESQAESSQKNTINIPLVDWTQRELSTQKKTTEENQNDLMDIIQSTKKEILGKIEGSAETLKSLTTKLKKEQTAIEVKLTSHMKQDPLPTVKIAQIKADILEEVKQINLAAA